MYLSRQACKVGGGGGGDDVILEDGGGYLCRVTGKFVSFSLSVLKFGVVRGGGGSDNEKIFLAYKEEEE